MNIFQVILLVCFLQVASSHWILNNWNWINSPISIADNFEFNFSLGKACENNTVRENITKTITDNWQECYANLTHRDREEYTGELYEDLQAICENQEGYLKCWDRMQQNILKECGNDKTPFLPGVYRASVASFCENDNGRKRIETIKKASAEAVEKEECCPEYTGIHWMISCKSFMDNFSSSDLCVRHDALNKCVQQLTCEEVHLSKIFRDVFKDARVHLGCKADENESEDMHRKIAHFFATMLGSLF